jgi:hypothetical protein
MAAQRTMSCQHLASIWPVMSTVVCRPASFQRMNGELNHRPNCQDLTHAYSFLTRILVIATTWSSQRAEVACPRLHATSLARNEGDECDEYRLQVGIEHFEMY